MTTPTAPSGVRYVPIAQIGRGGMAEVLLALAHAGGGARRLAVLKRIWPELRTDPDFVTMFLDEARLAVRLNHPNVVQTYEVLADPGELCIAMEYLDGQPLTRVCNRLLRGAGELALALRLRIVASVLAGLEHAHTLTDLDGTPLEVVHRDVSPQNVFVGYDGHVKLVDFGVAKTLGASHHTRPGALKGKLAYMAPEQLRGATMDRRADLFAVGVMLWEMLAGRRMWQALTEVEIVSHLASAQPLPPLPADANLPPDVDAICARALDPDPDRRYQTAASFEMDLEGVLVGSADSHARNLGKLMSLAFAAERAERQALIERAARQGGAAEAIPVPRAAPPDTAAVEVSLSGLEAGALAVAVAAAAPPRRMWLRRTATVAGLIAAVVTMLFAGGWRRTLADARFAQAGPRAPDRVATAAPGPGAQPADADRAGRETSGRATNAAEPTTADPQRPRRRHRARPVDEDATLPPSDADPEP